LLGLIGLIFLSLPSHGANCASPTGAEGTILYASDHNVLQYCDGASWMALGAFVASSGGGGSSEPDTTTGLIAHWTLDETSGSNIDDAAGTNDGTWDDNDNDDVAEETETGVIGGALTFDGSDDYIDMGDVLDMGTADATMAAWINTADCGGPETGIVSKRSDAGGADGYDIRCNGGSIKLTLGAASGSTYQFNGTVNIENGEWRHVAGTWDRDGDMTIYVDGVVDSSLDISVENGYDVQTNVELVIGALTGGGEKFFAGLIDDVRIYDRALSDDDIEALYLDGLENVVPDDPVAHWKLDETSGNTIDDAVGSNDGAWNDNDNDDVTEETTAGVIDNALAFDGTDDDVDIPDAAALDPGFPITLAAWVKPNAVGVKTNEVINKKCDSGNNGYRLRVGNAGAGTDEIAFSWGDGAATYWEYTDPDPILAGTWQHIAVTYDGTVVKMYYNGSSLPLESSGAHTEAIADNSSDLSIAGYQCSSLIYQFPGEIDDARIYDRALSPLELAALYAEGEGFFGGGATDGPCASPAACTVTD
jgi:hypothetical protein